jgi:formylglycine-generating enzyme
MNFTKWIAGLALVIGAAGVHGQTNLGLNLQMYAGITVTGVVGRTYELQATMDVNDSSAWNGFAAITLPASPQPYVYYDPANASRRFYRAIDRGLAPTNMVLIPAGNFTMGDTLGDGDTGGTPTLSVKVSAIYMDKYEVTKQLWDGVYLWATNHGYSFDNPGSGKATNHPVQMINWFDMLKWCNARSEQEGRTPAYYTDANQTAVYRSGQVNVQNDWVKWAAGYRLPTEAEWEKAARGGLSGKRFPWGDTITHSNANYNSDASFAYDISPTRGNHPDYDIGGTPYTSPVGSFAPNGYGLYDMAGNVLEWSWDWFAAYSNTSQTDPRGAATGTYRVLRGGSWYYDHAASSRVTYRGRLDVPTNRYGHVGFRSILPSNR